MGTNLITIETTWRVKPGAPDGPPSFVPLAIFSELHLTTPKLAQPDRIEVDCTSGGEWFADMIDGLDLGVEVVRIV